MKKDHLRILNNPTETAKAFGDYLIAQAMEQEVFHCALSGGSTPKLLFNYLSETYPKSAVWEKLHVYWGDERCVPPDHDESNFKMTNDLLLSKVPIPKANIHRVRGEEDPEQEAKRYGVEIFDTLGSSPCFDMIVLGMGEDGHTASIFPHQIALLKSKNICEVAIHPDSGQKRVTLTGTIINQAKKVAFLVTGEGKKEKIAEVFKKRGDWKTYPASYIDPKNGSLVWFLDQAAAGHVSLFI